jgi:hypothetical protein
MRIPPSMMGKKITVMHNGKRQQIIFSASGMVFFSLKFNLILYLQAYLLLAHLS